MKYKIGKIERVDQETPARFSYYLDGKRMSRFGTAQFKEGDEIVAGYETIEKDGAKYYDLVELRRYGGEGDDQLVSDLNSEQENTVESVDLDAAKLKDFDELAKKGGVAMSQPAALEKLEARWDREYEYALKRHTHLLRKCYNAVTDILGRAPAPEEGNVYNNLFIAVTRYRP